MYCVWALRPRAPQSMGPLQDCVLRRPMIVPMILAACGAPYLEQWFRVMKIMIMFRRSVLRLLIWPMIVAACGAIIISDLMPSSAQPTRLSDDDDDGLLHCGGCSHGVQSGVAPVLLLGSCASL